MLARLAAVRRVPRIATVAPVRFMSGSDSAGSVARSKEFGKKERAHEDQFVHQHEIEQLMKLKAEIEKKKAELDSLEVEHDSLVKNKGQ